ncbi:MAG: hypothetical protein IPJ89_04560 [Candidatus Iainarchaeum archaeon]|uniref:Uncharacterized protein n=1 Tax=Candidatus Iainarchaeum sp. TaxID=3101447 RepID=A0A7T9DJC2_9ARCH|nr:MAG: hypothetical protein IPJ89_04560 [Candidatus Diapherotrites archaeon]
MALRKPKITKPTIFKRFLARINFVKALRERKKYGKKVLLRAFTDSGMQMELRHNHSRPFRVQIQGSGFILPHPDPNARRAVVWTMVNGKVLCFYRSISGGGQWTPCAGIRSLPRGGYAIDPLRYRNKHPPEWTKKVGGQIATSIENGIMRLTETTDIKSILDYQRHLLKLPHLQTQEQVEGYFHLPRDYD